MKRQNIPQVAFWNEFADRFDAIYTGKGKSALARAVDRWLRKDMYQRFDWVMEKAGDVRGRRICDVGCGSGRFAAEIAGRGAALVKGVDVSPNMLSLARRLAGQKGVSGVCDFVQADVADWETDEQFDLLIAIGFWDYIAEPCSLLRRIRKLTSPGGRFLSAWPRFWTWRMPVRKLRLALRGCPVYFFRRPQVYRLLERSGFRVESCTVVGKLYCIEARPA
jgi:2-polyprenyl-3-methyl-5-hydroxy-6-metoxy-1,4-benzoquinol methylase